MKRQLLSAASAAALLAGMLLAGSAGALTAASGAGFTTVDEGVDGAGHCQNGNPSVNCNIYDAKEHVWMNGGPVGAALADGAYFFAVLAPSGQADPNDGTLDLLSEDAYTDRTFTVSNGLVTYTGSHDSDGNKIRLMPYANTPNPGGVYILAICSLGAGYPVAPSDCKYDAFKIQTGSLGVPLTITKDASGEDTNTFTWGISKSVDDADVTTVGGGKHTFNYTVSVTHDGGTISGVKVTGTIRVTNPNADDQNNTIPVAIDGVTDQLSDGTVCSVTGGGAQTLTQFQTDFAYKCDLTSLPQGALDNTASVSWPEDFSIGLLAGSADFTFKSISFTETKVDDCVAVTDTLAGSLGNVCSTNASPKEFKYGHEVDVPAGTCKTVDNTATLTTNTSGLTASAKKSATDCQGADLKVSKTANTSYTRTYNWTINKTVDEATRIDQIGGSLTLHYHVTATQTGVTDSAIQATGTITVTNPNDWESVTLTGVSDAVDNGGSCSITSGDVNGTLARKGTTGDSASFGYTCTYTSLPSAGTNTATATWDGTVASTPSGTASGTAAVSFGAPSSTVSRTITVQDSYNGGAATTLGTLTATDTAPFTSHAYDLSKVVTVPTNGQCLTVPNSGIIKETGAHSDVSNTICGVGGAGALTMGFWQNKNGQAIITGQAKTGTCPSATWLRTYKPFQDLVATSTCAQVATYVYNLIKAANASGSSMNAMLKAQMLASALDVYFSDPALGGNKIGAPAPIGPEKIDLTRICKMSDSSTGTGTCTGVYVNASAAFGGSTCLSVLDLLAWSNQAFGSNQPWGTNYVSNLGGSNWYGQVKATQELAKNTFDSMNNQKAFAC